MELVIREVSKIYKDKRAVDGVSVTLSNGVYGLLGANGAGKTTLMRIMCGVLEPDSGEVLCDGVEILSMGERYRDLIGYLPQNFGYYPDFTVMDFMLYIASLKGPGRELAKSRSTLLLQKVGLAGDHRTRIKALSGGMRQRLGIAQSLLNNPKLLVLDEPTAGLDPKERVRFRNMLAELGKDHIVLLSTHIVSDVEEIADQILIMKDGRLLTQGTFDHLKLECFGDVDVNLEKVYMHYFGEEGDEDGSL